MQAFRIALQGIGILTAGGVLVALIQGQLGTPGQRIGGLEAGNGITGQTAGQGLVAQLEGELAHGHPLLVARTKLLGSCQSTQQDQGLLRIFHTHQDLPHRAPWILDLALEQLIKGDEGLLDLPLGQGNGGIGLGDADGIGCERLPARERLPRQGPLLDGDGQTRGLLGHFGVAGALGGI